jgi:hypothetical protein
MFFRLLTRQLQTCDILHASVFNIARTISIPTDPVHINYLTLLALLPSQSPKMSDPSDPAFIIHSAVAFLYFLLAILLIHEYIYTPDPEAATTVRFNMQDLERLRPIQNGRDCTYTRTYIYAPVHICTSPGSGLEPVLWPMMHRYTHTAECPTGSRTSDTSEDFHNIRSSAFFPRSHFSPWSSSAGSSTTDSITTTTTRSASPTLRPAEVPEMPEIPGNFALSDLPGFSEYLDHLFSTRTRNARHAPPLPTPPPRCRPPPPSAP